MFISGKGIAFSVGLTWVSSKTGTNINFLISFSSFKIGANISLAFSPFFTTYPNSFHFLKPAIKVADLFCEYISNLFLILYFLKFSLQNFKNFFNSSEFSKNSFIPFSKLIFKFSNFSFLSI